MALAGKTHSVHLPVEYTVCAERPTHCGGNPTIHPTVAWRSPCVRPCVSEQSSHYHRAPLSSHRRPLCRVSQCFPNFLSGDPFFFKLQTIKTQFTIGLIHKNVRRTNLCINIPERFYCQFRIPLCINLNQPFQRDKSQLYFYALVIENIKPVLNTL